MKALSIKQPWAWLIVNGFKDIENRSWSSRFRGVFLIHAGKDFDDVGYQYVRANFDIKLPEKNSFQSGGIVGSAEMVKCVKKHNSPWFCSKSYGFVLKECLPLPLTNLSGKLNFFTTPPDLLGNLVGTVVKYDETTKTAKVRLFGPLYNGELIEIRGRSKTWVQKARVMSHNGDPVDVGYPGESILIIFKQVAEQGDHVYLFTDDFDPDPDPDPNPDPNPDPDPVKPDLPNPDPDPVKPDLPNPINFPNEPNNPKLKGHGSAG
jgi:hypothetical protein